MKKSLLKVIIITTALLMVAGCPDPLNIVTPTPTEQPAGGGQPESTPQVSYTVKHLKQDVTGNGYTEDEGARQSLSGTPGTATAAQARSFAGFTAQAFSQATIAADGSTIVSISYNRNVHSLSYFATTPGVTIPAAASYRFGAQVTIEFPQGISAWGYNGSTYTAENNTLTMPDSDVVLSETYNVDAENIVETLETLPDNDEDTPYTITVSAPGDLEAIRTALSDSDKFVTISLEDCEGLTSLPDNAFQGCTKIKSIVIPDTVTSVGTGVFSGCTELDSVTFSGNISSASVTGVINSLPPDTVIKASDPQSISSIAQGINVANRNVALSLEDCQGLTSLPDNAFQGCTKIESITLPSDLESIGNNAFAGCTNLDNVTIPPTVTSVGTGVFSGCTELDSVTFSGNISSASVTGVINSLPPDTVIKASDPQSISSIAQGINAANRNVALSLEDCEGLTSLPDNAFQGCTKIKSIVIPDTVTSVGTGVFSGCTELDSVTFSGNISSASVTGVINSLPPDTVIKASDPQSISSIAQGINAANRNVALSLEDCEGLTSLPDNAFQGCTKIKSIVIPDTVTSVGTGVFSGCTELDSVTLPGILNRTNMQNALGSLPRNNANTPYTIGITGQPRIADIKSAISSSGKYIALSLEDCQGLTSLTDEAFLICDKITRVTLPSSVTSIGNGAFADCTALTSITIPSSVTSIGVYAFSSCFALTSITIPSSVTSIGDYALNYCCSLTSITIPSSVTSIGDHAFSHCESLTSITIPSSVTSIGDLAFYDCNSLETINFQGTRAQWNNISEGSNPGYEYPNNMQVVCTDGTATP